MSCTRELVTGSGRLQFSYPSTQQHLLVWRDRPRSVMVIKKLGAELTKEFVEVVRFLGAEEHMGVIVEPHMFEPCAAHLAPPSPAHADAPVPPPPPPPYLFTYSNDELASGVLSDIVDFVVCLGGDGVILHASSLFHGALPPLVAFHLGSMGFLTNHAFKDLRRDLRGVIYGAAALETCSLGSLDGEGGGGGNGLGVMITLRMRLECAVLRRGASVPEQTYQVLNEVVLDRGSNSFLTNIECYIGGRLITRVQADGVMLATPTGSTAYSVAAGGSMVHPNVPAMLLTPICPHSLNFRPVILPDYVEVELRVPDGARCSAWVSFDGKQRQELSRGDSIRVKMSGHPVPTINKEDLTADWFESLERCFRWSNRTVQKPLEEGDEGSVQGGAGVGGGVRGSPRPTAGETKEAAGKAGANGAAGANGDGRGVARDGSVVRRGAGGDPDGVKLPQERSIRL